MATKVTMSDIARLAGVSTSTVSRALKGHASIPESTRQRIQKIATDNNYVLNARARNFRLKRSQTIATVFPYQGKSKRMISDPFYMEMLGAIADELALHNYDLMISRVSLDNQAWCVDYVQNKLVAGIVIVDCAVDDLNIQRLQDLNANFVVLKPPDPDQTFISVGGYSYQAGVEVVNHLYNLGRRKIGFIGGHRGMVETDLRYKGYMQGLREVGLDYDNDLVYFTDFSPQAGATATRSLLQTCPDLDAIFICSDFMAIAAMQVLVENNRHIPDDVSIVGYDDVQLARHSTPPLTTVHQEITASGQLLVRKLLAMIDGKSVESEHLPVQLIVRSSCGSPERDTKSIP